MNKAVLIFAGAVATAAASFVAYKLIKKSKEEKMQTGIHEIESKEYFNSKNTKVNVHYFDDDEEFVVFRGCSDKPIEWKHLDVEESIALIGEEAYDHALACSENRKKQMPRFIFVRNYDKKIDYRIIMDPGSYKEWTANIMEVKSDAASV